jgi:signal transduction histidine kinase
LAPIAARETAERANRAQRVFLSNTSHQNRTLLKGVLGCTELLRGNANFEQM